MKLAGDTGLNLGMLGLQNFIFYKPFWNHHLPREHI